PRTRDPFSHLDAHCCSQRELSYMICLLLAGASLGQRVPPVPVLGRIIVSRSQTGSEDLGRRLRGLRPAAPTHQIAMARGFFPPGGDRVTAELNEREGRADIIPRAAREDPSASHRIASDEIRAGPAGGPACANQGRAAPRAEPGRSHGSWNGTDGRETSLAKG